MAQISRRDVLLAGLALPGIARAVRRDTPDDDASLKPKRFEEIVGFEVAEVAASHPLARLPLGSLEFHGPHNPLGVDSIIISGSAEHVSARTDAVLFPTIKFTQCPAHTAYFQGTVSIRPEVMTMYYADALRNILHIGFRKIFILQWARRQYRTGPRGNRSGGR
ncbi:MAG: creatininase family protein [Candidatus Acidiferrales bacterium]